MRAYLKHMYAGHRYIFKEIWWWETVLRGNGWRSLLKDAEQDLGDCIGCKNTSIYTQWDNKAATKTHCIAFAACGLAISVVGYQTYAIHKRRHQSGSIRHPCLYRRFGLRSQFAGDIYVIGWEQQNALIMEYGRPISQMESLISAL